MNKFDPMHCTHVVLSFLVIDLRLNVLIARSFSLLRLGFPWYATRCNICGMYKNRSRYRSRYHTIGPLLFIFYVNDIVQTKGALKINMYAYVFIMFKSGNNWNTMSAT